VIAQLEPKVAKALPEIEVKFFQGGSETIAARVNAELTGGKTQADLLLTSDPFWYQELKTRGALLPYESAAAKGVPAEWQDPEHTFTASRVPVMVIGAHTTKISDDIAPKKWSDLLDPRWKGQISLGSPLESGTTFTAVALFGKTPGWSLVEGLRKQDAISAGGNSAVLNRIETGERPLGIVLLENILKAQQKGATVRAIYPEDGVLPIPSPIAITAKTANPAAAKKLYDWFFSQEVQADIVASGMYSPLPGGPTPPGGRPWSEIAPNAAKWSPELIRELFASRESTKSRFQALWLN
jgi:iron(III) transport system substrate-binding protein